MTFRNAVLVFHRWLGLSGSLVLFVVGATGAVLVFGTKTTLAKISYSGPLHETLGLSKIGLGSIGWWIVVSFTAAAVILELTGLVLWWRRKTVLIRMRSGWRQALIDVHYSIGAVLFPIMFLLALTGVGLTGVFGLKQPPWRATIFELHTGKEKSLPIRLLYAAGSLSFCIQGATGVVMWLPPRRRLKSSSPPKRQVESVT